MNNLNNKDKNIIYENFRQTLFIALVLGWGGKRIIAIVHGVWEVLTGGVGYCAISLSLLSPPPAPPSHYNDCHQQYNV